MANPSDPTAKIGNLESKGWTSWMSRGNQRAIAAQARKRNVIEAITSKC